MALSAGAVESQEWYVFSHLSEHLSGHTAGLGWALEIVCLKIGQTQNLISFPGSYACLSMPLLSSWLRIFKSS